MNEVHRKHLAAYMNDMLAVERDLSQAVRGQLEDKRIDRHEGLRDILHDIVAGSEGRTDILRKIFHSEGGTLGATVKGTMMPVAGTLAGIYDRLREHPVSRIHGYPDASLRAASLEIYSVNRGVLPLLHQDISRTGRAAAGNHILSHVTHTHAAPGQ